MAIEEAVPLVFTLNGKVVWMQFDIMPEDSIAFGQVFVPLLIKIYSSGNADRSKGNVLLNSCKAISTQLIFINYIRQKQCYVT